MHKWKQICMRPIFSSGNKTQGQLVYLNPTLYTYWVQKIDTPNNIMPKELVNEPDKLILLVATPLPKLPFVKKVPVTYVECDFYDVL